MNPKKNARLTSRSASDKPTPPRAGPEHPSQHTPPCQQQCPKKPEGGLFLQATALHPSVAAGGPGQRRPRRGRDHRHPTDMAATPRQRPLFVKKFEWHACEGNPKFTREGTRKTPVVPRPRSPVWCQTPQDSICAGNGGTGLRGPRPPGIDRCRSRTLWGRPPRANAFFKHLGTKSPARNRCPGTVPPPPARPPAFRRNRKPEVPGVTASPSEVAIAPHPFFPPGRDTAESTNLSAG